MLQNVPQCSHGGAIFSNLRLLSSSSITAVPEGKRRTSLPKCTSFDTIEKRAFWGIATYNVEFHNFSSTKRPGYVRLRQGYEKNHQTKSSCGKDNIDSNKVPCCSIPKRSPPPSLSAQGGSTENRGRKKRVLHLVSWGRNIHPKNILV